jgi:hypothetical protein
MTQEYDASEFSAVFFAGLTRRQEISGSDGTSFCETRKYEGGERPKIFDYLKVPWGYESIDIDSQIFHHSQKPTKT